MPEIPPPLPVKQASVVKNSPTDHHHQHHPHHHSRHPNAHHQNQSRGENGSAKKWRILSGLFNKEKSTKSKSISNLALRRYIKFRLPRLGGNPYPIMIASGKTLIQFHVPDKNVISLHIYFIASTYYYL